VLECDPPMRPESRSLAPAGVAPAGRLPAESQQAGVSSSEARAAVARITTRHYENFPVASLLVPASIRPAVRAVYAFARGADDFADEPEHAGHRMARLEEWEGLLRGAFAGEATEPVFVALAEAAQRHALPIEPFLDLLAAFRMDAVETRYADWEGLVGYCRLSANPVGRIILHLFGRTSAELLPLSDSICTGLQLANHWQDLAVDAARGRFYVPAETLRRHGIAEAALATGVADDRFRGLMRELLRRSRPYFLAGRPLCDLVTGRLRAELRLTWHGGFRVLERIEAADYDVYRRRPRLGPGDACVVAWRALLWRS
jgi:squalene synthase HpnC